jgi:hypothetical protein
MSALWKSVSTQLCGDTMLVNAAFALVFSTGLFPDAC